MEYKLDSKAPSGPLETRWQRHIAEMKLVNPANKRSLEIIKLLFKSRHSFYRINFFSCQNLLC